MKESNETNITNPPICYFLLLYTDANKMEQPIHNSHLSATFRYLTSNKNHKYY